VRSEDWARIRSLLGEALELAPGERAAWLRALPAEQRALAPELARWLELEPDLEFLARPAVPAASWGGPRRLALGPDARIGRYRVCALLGLGGSGVVFEAEQDEPRRRVALKILQRGLTSPAARRRFLDEARALARLDDPGVARVLEAGTFLQDGVETPFIAMELVEDACDLLAYAAAKALGRAERLALFLELCRAVGQGPARGVIHRDLTPANVLVDGRGRVKVIDFGIARVADAGASGARPTACGDVLGTAPYMSPEQARGELDAFDTRTDVYALGVLLHELLLGVLPAPALGLVPGRPRDLDARLPADLEAVLLCALAPEPARRYASAHELGADLRRFLEHRPVEARPPRFVHHARLLVRRHRRAVAAWGLLLATACVAVLGIALRSARVEARERAKAERVTAFLLSVFERAKPSVSGRGEVLLRDTLAEAAARVDAELGDALAERAVLHATIGIALRELGAFEPAVRELESALALSRAEAEDGTQSACWLNALGDVLVSAGRPIEAEAVLREALALQERHPDTSPIEIGITSNHLARALLAQGERTESLALATRARELYARELGPRHAAVAAAERTLGDVARAGHELDRAREHYQAALEVHSEAFGADSLKASEDRLRLGALLLEAGDGAAARVELERARVRLGELLPPDHPDLRRLAQLLQNSVP
jgi:tetratricopeptide (TPR) repeat protein